MCRLFSDRSLHQIFYIAIMKKVAFRFGLLAVAVIMLIQLSKYSYLSYGLKQDLVIGVLALIFVGLGIYLSKLFQKPERSLVATGKINQGNIKKLGISHREYEVLEQLARGKSNQEIADQLFISESTVKTHVSNLLVKLNAKRRTQAIKIAKEMNILI